MILSFAARLFCVAAISTGLMHLILEFFLWLTSPFVVGRLAKLPARHRERLLYALQLAPIVAAWVLGGVVCIPRYIGSEENRDAEAIGWLCIAVAAAVVVWYGLALLRGCAVAARTLSFARVCRRVSSPISLRRAGAQILSYPGDVYGVALVGLFRPFILISESLLGASGLSHQAIDIVLDHEAAHAAQLDNWKLFSLHCLPSQGLRLRDGKTWAELWRSAAEWAADDDAVGGDSARILMLAETLVAVARRGASQPNRLCMALECDESELAARVDRLIGRPTEPMPSGSWKSMCGAVLGVAVTVGVGLGLLLSSHELLERLLHLG
jgi:beta-lactamase regulating signal transducer with metallopeptidase domain